MRNIVLILSFVFLLILGFAQADVVGSLIVHVYSENGRQPVSHVQVTIEEVGGNGLPRRMETDANGKAVDSSLSIGEYEVGVESEGFASEPQTAIIRVNAPTELFFALEKTAETENVVKIVSKRVLMNARDTAGSSTFKDRVFMETRMADNRSLAGVADLSPGVAADSQGLLHFRGEHRSMSLELDGILLPIPLQSQIGSLIDPRFLEDMEVRTGSYDPTFSGQLGGVLNLVTRTGEAKPFYLFNPEAGNLGEQGGVFMTGGGSDEGYFSYFFGGSANHTNLRLEAPNPNFQTLNNQGDDANSLLHLSFQRPNDKVNVTLATQNLRLNLPNTPSEQTAGINQWQRENNIVGAGSLRHQFSQRTQMLLGISFLVSHQAVGNNGIFNPWTTANAVTMPNAAAEMLPANPEDPGNPFLPNLSRTGSQKLLNFIFTHEFSSTNTLRWGGAANFIHLDDTVDITDSGGSGLLPGSVRRYVVSDHRSGFDGGLFVGDTWQITPKLSANFGVRLDRYNNGVNVNTSQISPLFNFSYAFSSTQALRWSIARLFTAPPLEPDPTGATNVIPQKTADYELSYEVQPTDTLVMKLGAFEKNYRDPLDLALLVPLSNLPVFVPVNFPKGQTVGIELSAITQARRGLNWFFNFSGTSMHILTPSPGSTSIPLVDHFENRLITFGPSYRWKNGFYMSVDNKYGSGFAQDAIVAYNKDGIYPFGIHGTQSRFITNFKLGYVPNNPDSKAGVELGFSVEILNVFNNKRIMNLLSNFSGTRFVQQRRSIVELTAKF